MPLAVTSATAVMTTPLLANVSTPLSTEDASVDSRSNTESVSDDIIPPTLLVALMPVPQSQQRQQQWIFSKARKHKFGFSNDDFQNGKVITSIATDLLIIEEIWTY